MKINIVPAVIAFLLAILFAYAIYALSNDNEPYIVVLLFTSFISFCSSLMGAMGISLEDNKHNVNIRILSIVFFFLFIAEHGIISYVGVTLSTLIILSGILLLLYMLLIYTISKMQM